MVKGLFHGWTWSALGRRSGKPRDLDGHQDPGPHLVESVPLVVQPLLLDHPF